MKDILTQRMKALNELKEQMVGQYNALIGRIQETEHLLAEWEKTYAVKVPAEDAVNAA
jgi:hypothetical protein